MTRLLALTALAVVLWIFLEIVWNRMKRALGGGQTKLPEIPLVRCSGCGVHVSRGQVVGGLCEECCSPHPRPLSQPHTRTPGRGESARSDS